MRQRRSSPNTGASTSWYTGHGPGRGLTKEQFADLYNINVLSSQRVNRAVLPRMKECRQCAGLDRQGQSKAKSEEV